MSNDKPAVSFGKFILWTCALLVLSFLIIEGWSTWHTTRDSAALLDALAKLPSTSLSDEKTRQEVIALRLKNEQQRLFVSALVSNFSVTIGLIAAISGAWIAFHQYLQTRTRERLDRAALDFAALWEGLSSGQSDKRAGSVAALADYIGDDKSDFHGRVASALALVGRMKNDPVVNRTITPVIELTMSRRANSARAVSWQGLKLFRANFAGLQLKGLDFRDSDLQEADFRGTNLESARFDAAHLVGANFDAAKLAGANLAYADLARATMQGADLREADLRNIQLLDLDINGADLRGARFAPHATDWRLVKNWRNAILDPKMRDSLLELYGPPLHAPKILMLMWEYPPIISGGGWTAVYHFLTALRRRGADLVVVVPLPKSVLDRSVFGNEIETIGVGTEEDVANLAEISAYTSYRSESGISMARRKFQYDRAVPSLMNLVNEFQLRVVRAIDELRLDCDVIHAHDWLTFPAAAAAAKTLSRPWVAHFHSTEQDRQPGEPSPKVLRIEAEACRKANRLVTVSRVTCDRVADEYKVSIDKIDIVPNCLAEEHAAHTNLGSFATKRVVFLGRLAKQKGIDRFIEIAGKLRKIHTDAQFVVYGDGPERDRATQSATEEHEEIPEDQIIPPLDARELKLGVRHVEFSKIVPVSRDHDGKFKPVGVSMNEKKKEALEEEIFRLGFTAISLRDDTYTHIIHVESDSAELYPYYAVKVYDGLKRIRKWTTSFVKFNGALSWPNRFDAFERASVVIVPSRFEPFGLVVLEAMGHGVPVLYPRTAGVAEVLQSGIPFDTIEDAVREASLLLSDKVHWEKTVEAELLEINQYPRRKFESQLEDVWNRVLGVPAKDVAQKAS
ncbi:MAG TPA: pentapeptide repeat-containing protein [Candidatus Dormibacteraeota bacterium]|nr:pentapeptide repeat-containing protein [Candidatus Dormibacteraeota bacterium]